MEMKLVHLGSELEELNEASQSLLWGGSLNVQRVALWPALDFTQQLLNQLYDGI